jgi:hypothetical protein
MLRHVAIVKTDVSEEINVSIRVTRIGELGATNKQKTNSVTLSPRANYTG